MIDLPLRITALVKYLAAAMFGSFLTIVVTFVAILGNRPALESWHLAKLDEEYTRDSAITSFDQYLELEDRLFAQLDALVYDQVPEGPNHAVNRYSRGSLADPGRWPVNWNRSFEMVQAQPRAGVLLLHGLSDSPYSMRALGQELHNRGATVLGLRLPGHGTAPSGLVGVTWQDMAAAVRLAARHLSDAVGSAPLFIVGYSNGGALSIEYALAGLSDPSLPGISGIVLLSPEIGVSPVAALAIWQGRIGRLPGFEKLAWNTLLPEYDPFKYGSFAVNAGDLAHRITTHIQKQLDKLQESGELSRLPPILAFQSSVDSTVTAPALVTNLFDRLPPAGHELVLFDLNRRIEIETLVASDPRLAFEAMLKDDGRRFDLTVVTNVEQNSNQVQAHRARAGETPAYAVHPAGEWPQGVFSLSHVALPFSPDDPVYGGPDAQKSPGIQLGNLALRGERSVLRISGTDIMRLRWNPFYDYMSERILQFTALGEP